MPGLVSRRAVAPDWASPTEGNGAGCPPGDLHVALIAPDRAAAAQLRRVRVIKPPLWRDGRVFLHVIVDTDRTRHRDVDLRVLQAVVDLGWADAADLDIGPPADLTLGYPSEDSP